MFTVKNYRYELRDRHAMNREIRVTTIMEESFDLDMTTMTDAQSLYDCLNREQFASTEKRAASEISVIRDALENLGGQCRWFPRELNPADLFAKLKGECAASITIDENGKAAHFRREGRNGTQKSLPRGHWEA